MRAITRLVSCLLMLTGAAVCGFAQTGAQKQNTAPRPLFQHIRPAKPPATSDLRGMLEYQPVNIRWETLYALQPGSRVKLNLLKDYSLIAYIERVERHDEHRVSYFGRLDGVPDGYSHVILTNVGDVLLATIYSPPLDINFGVSCYRGEYHLAYRVDRLVRADCATVQIDKHVPDHNPTSVNGITNPSELAPVGDFAPSACVQPTAKVDIMVVYTPAVLNLRVFGGNRDAVLAAAQLAVDNTNIIYQNSQIPLQARLVFVGEVDYDEGSLAAKYHLDPLEDPSDGFMDIVHTWRDQYRADQVALFVVDAGGPAGVARGSVTPEGAFFVVGLRTGNDANSLSNPVFTHELGHNQGCDHNRANASGAAFASYSYGYRFVGRGGLKYVTLMAYPVNSTDCTGSGYQGASIIPFFSNPDITYAGEAIGRPEGHGCAADNARTVRETARICEDFRLLDIWVQFGYAGTERGTFNEPYNTVAEGANAITHYPTLVIPTLYIKAGSRDEILTINKRMRVEACGGTVRIGAP